MTSRRSSGSMLADSAVEPTRSENITVTWRRSARSSECGPEVLDAVAVSAEGALPVAPRRAAIASSNVRRCPRAATPSSFRSSAVRFGRTFSVISFSRNAPSYFPRPNLRSQTTMSTMARPIQGSCTSSFRLGGVSRRPETAADNRFRCQSVPLSKTVPRLVATYPVPISVRGTIGNCATSSLLHLPIGNAVAGLADRFQVEHGCQALKVLDHLDPQLLQRFLLVARRQILVPA